MHSRLGRLIRASSDSLRGIAFAYRNEPSFQEEIAAFIVAIFISVFIAPSAGWYVAMVGVLLIVIAIELLNTGLEKLADHVSPEWNAQIGLVKDCGSAAVLCILMVAVLIWTAALGVRVGLFS